MPFDNQGAMLPGMTEEDLKKALALYQTQRPGFTQKQPQAQMDGGGGAAVPDASPDVQAAAVAQAKPPQVLDAGGSPVGAQAPINLPASALGAMDRAFAPMPPTKTLSGFQDPGRDAIASAFAFGHDPTTGQTDLGRGAAIYDKLSAGNTKDQLDRANLALSQALGVNTVLQGNSDRAYKEGDLALRGGDLGLKRDVFEEGKGVEPIIAQVIAEKAKQGQPPPDQVGVAALVNSLKAGGLTTRADRIGARPGPKDIRVKTGNDGETKTLPPTIPPQDSLAGKLAALPNGQTLIENLAKLGATDGDKAFDLLRSHLGDQGVLANQDLVREILSTKGMNGGSVKDAYSPGPVGKAFNWVAGLNAFPGMEQLAARPVNEKYASLFRGDTSRNDLLRTLFNLQGSATNSAGSLP